MFIGHYAAALAAKSVAPRPSLGTYFIAAQFIDLLWPILLLLGIERASIVPGITTMTPLDFEHYPYSHSLIAVLIWAGLFGSASFRRFKEKKSAWVLGLCVLSHWFLDLVVHRPDLPLLTSDGPRFGLSLWNSVAGTVVLEASLFIFGLWLYLRATRPKDRGGKLGLFALALTLMLIWAANFAGPPPPSIEAVAVTGNLQWLFVIWAYWADHRRTARS